MRYLGNTFSINMLGRDLQKLYFIRMNTESVCKWCEQPFESVVDHESTAKLFSSLLGRIIPYNRTNLILEPGDSLIVGQYTSEAKWWHVYFPLL